MGVLDKILETTEFKSTPLDAYCKFWFEEEQPVFWEGGINSPAHSIVRQGLGLSGELYWGYYHPGENEVEVMSDYEPEESSYLDTILGTFSDSTITWNRETVQWEGKWLKDASVDPWEEEIKELTNRSVMVDPGLMIPKEHFDKFVMDKNHSYFAKIRMEDEPSHRSLILYAMENFGIDENTFITGYEGSWMDEREGGWAGNSPHSIGIGMDREVSDSVLYSYLSRHFPDRCQISSIDGMTINEPFTVGDLIDSDKEWFSGENYSSLKSADTPPFDRTVLYDLVKFIGLKDVSSINYEEFMDTTESSEEDVTRLLEILTEVGALNRTEDLERHDFEINPETFKSLLSAVGEEGGSTPLLDAFQGDVGQPRVSHGVLLRSETKLAADESTIVTVQFPNRDEEIHVEVFKGTPDKDSRFIHCNGEYHWWYAEDSVSTWMITRLGGFLEDKEDYDDYFAGTYSPSMYSDVRAIISSKSQDPEQWIIDKLLETFPDIEVISWNGMLEIPVEVFRGEVNQFIFVVSPSGEILYRQYGAEGNNYHSDLARELGAKEDEEELTPKGYSFVRGGVTRDIFFALPGVIAPFSDAQWQQISNVLSETNLEGIEDYQIEDSNGMYEPEDFGISRVASSLSKLADSEPVSTLVRIDKDVDGRTIFGTGILADSGFDPVTGEEAYVAEVDGEKVYFDSDNAGFCPVYDRYMNQDFDEVIALIQNGQSYVWVDNVDSPAVSHREAADALLDEDLYDPSVIQVVFNGDTLKVFADPTISDAVDQSLKTLEPLSPESIEHNGEIYKSSKSSSLAEMRESWGLVGVDLQAYESSSGNINLSMIRVDKEIRGQGLAQETMEELINYADKAGKVIVLTPTNEFGASKRRLTDWYKTLGFIENKGKGKDYQISDSMYRLPSSSVISFKTGEAEQDYWGGHRPMKGPPVYDLLKEDETPAPPDVYEHPEYYIMDYGSSSAKETLSVLQKVRGNPGAMVTIYRSAPPGTEVFNTGDWIALSHSYSEKHGYHPTDPSQDWPVYSAKVSAEDVLWAGDDLMEYGYWGDPVPAQREKTLGSKYSSILSPINNQLADDIWDLDAMTVEPELERFVWEKIEDALSSYDTSYRDHLKRLYIIGSITGLQYSEDSDVDVNVYLDIDSWAFEIGEDPEDLRNSVRRSLVNENGEPPPDSSHPVNFYLSSTPSDPPADGIYDLLENIWIKHPEEEYPEDFDPYLEFDEAFLRAEELAERVDKMWGAAKRANKAFMAYGGESHRSRFISSLKSLVETYETLAQERRDVFDIGHRNNIDVQALQRSTANVVYKALEMWGSRDKMLSAKVALKQIEDEEHTPELVLEKFAEGSFQRPPRPQGVHEARHYVLVSGPEYKPTVDGLMWDDCPPETPGVYLAFNDIGQVFFWEPEDDMSWQRGLLGLKYFRNAWEQLPEEFFSVWEEKQDISALEDYIMNPEIENMVIGWERDGILELQGSPSFEMSGSSAAGDLQLNLGEMNIRGITGVVGGEELDEIDVDDFIHLLFSSESEEESGDLEDSSDSGGYESGEIEDIVDVAVLPENEERLHKWLYDPEQDELAVWPIGHSIWGREGNPHHNDVENALGLSGEGRGYYNTSFNGRSSEWGVVNISMVPHDREVLLQHLLVAFPEAHAFHFEDSGNRLSREEVESGDTASPFELAEEHFEQLLTPEKNLLFYNSDTYSSDSGFAFLPSDEYPYVWSRRRFISGGYNLTDEDGNGAPIISLLFEGYTLAEVDDTEPDIFVWDDEQASRINTNYLQKLVDQAGYVYGEIEGDSLLVNAPQGMDNDQFTLLDDLLSLKDFPDITIIESGASYSFGNSEEALIYIGQEMTIQSSLTREIGKTSQENFPHTGVMVALIPPEETRRAFESPEGDGYEEHHITLAYLPDLDQEDDSILGDVYSWAQDQNPPEGSPSGYGTFRNNQNVLYVGWDIPGIDDFRSSLCTFLEKQGYSKNCDGEHGFTAHETVLYQDEDIRELPEWPEGVDQMQFFTLVVAMGDDWQEVPFGSQEKVSSISSEPVEIFRGLMIPSNSRIETLEQLNIDWNSLGVSWSSDKDVAYSFATNKRGKSLQEYRIYGDQDIDYWYPMVVSGTVSFDDVEAGASPYPTQEDMLEHWYSGDFGADTYDPIEVDPDSMTGELGSRDLPRDWRQSFAEAYGFESFDDLRGTDQFSYGDEEKELTLQRGATIDINQVDLYKFESGHSQLMWNDSANFSVTASSKKLATGMEKTGSLLTGDRVVDTFRNIGTVVQVDANRDDDPLEVDYDSGSSFWESEEELLLLPEDFSTESLDGIFVIATDGNYTFGSRGDLHGQLAQNLGFDLQDVVRGMYDWESVHVVSYYEPLNKKQTASLKEVLSMIKEEFPYEHLFLGTTMNWVVAGDGEYETTMKDFLANKEAIFNQEVPFGMEKEGERVKSRWLEDFADTPDSHIPSGKFIYDLLNDEGYFWDEDFEHSRISDIIGLSESVGYFQDRTDVAIWGGFSRNVATVYGEDDEPDSSMIQKIHTIFGDRSINWNGYPLNDVEVSTEKTSGIEIDEEGHLSYQDDHWGNGNKFLIDPEGTLYHWQTRDNMTTHHGQAMLALEGVQLVLQEEDPDDEEYEEHDGDMGSTMDFFENGGVRTRNSWMLDGWIIGEVYSGNRKGMIATWYLPNEVQAESIDRVFNETGIGQIHYSEGSKDDRMMTRGEMLRYFGGGREVSACFWSKTTNMNLSDISTLISKNDLYWRLHWQDTSEFSSDNAKSRRWGDHETLEFGENVGYSCFDNYRDLLEYFENMIDDLLEENVVIFSGEYVGKGHDDEPLVVPDGQETYWITMEELLDADEAQYQNSSLEHPK